MDFFIPGIRDAAEAESVVASICSIVQQSAGIRPNPNKVRAIEFCESGYREVAIVGCEFEYEMVSCIVETKDSFLIFTPNRGLRRGEPTRIAKVHVLKVESFSGARRTGQSEVHRPRKSVPAPAG
jgi:hypothetical protein